MKPKYIAFFTALVSILLIFNGCEHQPQEIIKPESNNTPVTPPTTTVKCSPDTVYFNTILAILTSNCNGTGCHNAIDRQEDVVLDNYNNIKKIVSPGSTANSKLYKYITSSSKIMPPSGKMPQATIDLIKKWIEQGAKNNYCNDACDTTKFSYAADIATIINNNCMGCHATGTTKIGTYPELKSQVDNSKLWASINHYSGALPMPTSTLQISTCEIKKIQKWIAMGAPNN